MEQAKYEATDAAIQVRLAFFKEMEALGIEGYVGLSYAINSGDPRANCEDPRSRWIWRSQRRQRDFTG
jgi:hypothetical protein